MYEPAPRTSPDLVLCMKFHKAFDMLCINANTAKHEIIKQYTYFDHVKKFVHFIVETRDTNFSALVDNSKTEQFAISTLLVPCANGSFLRDPRANRPPVLIGVQTLDGEHPGKPTRAGGVRSGRVAARERT